MIENTPLEEVGSLVMSNSLLLSLGGKSIMDYRERIFMFVTA